MTAEEGLVGPNGPSDGDKDIQQIWSDITQVVNRLARASGVDPKIAASMDIRGVLQCLEDVGKTTTTPGKFSWVKSVFDNTLSCLSTVGGIVSDGASYVFSPAGTCYSALTFVIQAWRGYEGIFESLATLLQECSDFLGRLEEYKSVKMDPKLTKVACQHLQIFVAVCERTVKLRESKIAKLKLFTSNFFLGDKTVSPLMDNMKSLVDRERGLVASLTFKFAAENLAYSREAAQNSRDNLALTQGIDTKVTAVGDKIAQQQRKEEAERWKNTIARAVGFGDEYPPKIAAYAQAERLRESMIAGSGEWLMQDETFLSWAKASAASKPVLALEGSNGSGRSHLLLNALRHLSRIHAESGSPKLIVSYYFHQADSRALTSRNEILSRISRSLLWQACVAHEPLTKSVAAICNDRKTGEFESILDRWNFLLLNNADVQKLGINFVVVVDGLGDMVDALVPLCQGMREGLSGNSFRLLLTTRPGGVRSMLLPASNMIGAIPLEGKTLPDVELYINARLDTMEAFRDSTRPDVPEWRANILKSLRDKTSGDYVKLVKCLDDIEKIDLVEEIQEVLDNAGKTRADQIEAEIQGLNKTRTAKEIDEINQIILWMNTARESLFPDQLDAMLAVGQSASGISSLLPLEAKLRSKYTLFEVSTAGKVEYRSPEVRDCIRRREEIGGGDYQVGSAASREISHSEVGMVKHFLNSVCPQETYEKFGFDQFLEAKMRGTRNYICKDPDNAEVRIAITCLKVLSEPRNPKTAKLLPYAAQFLLSHLQKADLSLADRDIKGQAGALLYKLFNTTFGVDSLFWPVDHEERDYTLWLAEVQPWARAVRIGWVHTDEGMKELTRWLKDTAVFRGITEEDGRKWAMQLIQDGARGYEFLFRHVTKPMAERLLRDGFWREELCTAISFLVGYFAQVSPDVKRPKLRGDEETADTDIVLDVETIRSTVALSRELLAESFTDLEWDLIAADIPRYFLVLESLKRARIDAAHKVLAEQPGHWRAIYAISTETIEDRGSVISIMRQGLDVLQDNQAWLGMDPHRQRHIHDHLFEMLAANYIDSNTDENFGLAVTALQKCFQEQVHASRVACRLLRVAIGKAELKDQWEHIITLVEATLQHRNTWEELRLQADEIFTWIAVIQAIRRAAMATSRMDILDRIYQPAIDLAASRKQLDDLCWWTSVYAIGIMSSDKQRALNLMDQALGRLPKLVKEREVLLLALRRHIAPNYVLNAIEAGTDSETASRYLAAVRIMHNNGGVDGASPPTVTEWDRNETDLLVARYHQIQGNATRARKEVSDTMVRCLALLSDDDPSNDSDAFWWICACCATCDDDENAIAAFHMNVRNWHQKHKEYEEKLEDWKTKHPDESKKEPETQAQDADDLQNQVDGATKPATEGDTLIANPKVAGTETADRSNEQQLDTAAPASLAPVPSSDTLRESDPKSGDHEGTEGTKPDDSDKPEAAENPTGESSTDEPTEHQKQEKTSLSSGNTDPKPDEPDQPCTCDECDEGIVTEDVWWCRLCSGQRQYNTKCYEKIADGTMQHLLCTKEHSFLKVPKLDLTTSKTAEVAVGFILIGTNLVSLEDWKALLKAKYVDL